MILPVTKNRLNVYSPSSRSWIHLLDYEQPYGPKELRQRTVLFETPHRYNPTSFNEDRECQGEIVRGEYRDTHIAVDFAMGLACGAAILPCPRQFIVLGTGLGIVSRYWRQVYRNNAFIVEVDSNRQIIDALYSMCQDDSFSVTNMKAQDFIRRRLRAWPTCKVDVIALDCFHGVKEGIDRSFASSSFVSGLARLGHVIVINMCDYGLHASRTVYDSIRDQLSVRGFKGWILNEDDPDRNPHLVMANCGAKRIPIRAWKQNARDAHINQRHATQMLTYLNSSTFTPV